MAVSDDQPLSVGNLAALIDSGAVGGVLNATSASGSGSQTFYAEDEGSIALSFTSPSQDGFSVSGATLTCQKAGTWRVRCQHKSTTTDSSNNYVITPRLYVSGVGYVIPDAGLDTTTAIALGATVGVTVDVARDGNGTGRVDSSATVTLERIK